jgi:hypothetical protein
MTSMRLTQLEAVMNHLADWLAEGLGGYRT